MRVPGVLRTQIPPSPFGSAADPSPFVPITLPRIWLFALPTWSITPHPVLPEITFRSATVFPPTTEPALPRNIPSPFPSPAAKVESVPMKLPVIVTDWPVLVTLIPCDWKRVIVTFVTLLAPGVPVNRSPFTLPARAPSIRGPGVPWPTTLTSVSVGSPPGG